jgi:hypothetical protein
LESTDSCEGQFHLQGPAVPALFSLPGLSLLCRLRCSCLAAFCRHWRGNADEGVEHIDAALEIPRRSSYVPASRELALHLGFESEARLENARLTRLELPAWMKF